MNNIIAVVLSHAGNALPYPSELHLGWQGSRRSAHDDTRPKLLFASHAIHHCAAERRNKQAERRALD